MSSCRKRNRMYFFNFRRANFRHYPSNYPSLSVALSACFPLKALLSIAIQWRLYFEPRSSRTSVRAVCSVIKVVVACEVMSDWHSLVVSPGGEMSATAAAAWQRQAEIMVYGAALAGECLMSAVKPKLANRDLRQIDST
eukprot:637864-Amphidinium_carterae.1